MGGVGAADEGTVTWSAAGVGGGVGGVTVSGPKSDAPDPCCAPAANDQSRKKRTSLLLRGRRIDALVHDSRATLVGADPQLLLRHRLVRLAVPTIPGLHRLSALSSLLTG